MAIWYNYCIVLPLKETYVDDGSRDLCTAHINITTAGEFQVSLVGTQTAIELIRVATLNSDGNLTPRQSETVGKIIDHMLAVLRLTFDADVQLFRKGPAPFSLGCRSVNDKPSLKFAIKEHLNIGFVFNADNIRNTFVHTASMRHLTILLGDTQDGALPLQYRYLSLYKAFELEFRASGKWVDLTSLFASVNERYLALDVSKRPLAKLFHEPRDKCAHIKTGGTDHLGIVGLNDPDSKLVSAIYPLLLETILAHISVNNKDIQ